MVSIEKYVSRTQPSYDVPALEKDQVTLSVLDVDLLGRFARSLLLVCLLRLPNRHSHALNGLSRAYAFFDLLHGARDRRGQILILLPALGDVPDAKKAAEQLVLSFGLELGRVWEALAVPVDFFLGVGRRMEVTELADLFEEHVCAVVGQVISSFGEEVVENFGVTLLEKHDGAVCRQRMEPFLHRYSKQYAQNLRYLDINLEEPIVDDALQRLQHQVLHQCV